MAVSHHAGEGEGGAGALEGGHAIERRTLVVMQDSIHHHGQRALHHLPRLLVASLHASESAAGACGHVAVGLRASGFGVRVSGLGIGVSGFGFGNEEGLTCCGASGARRAAGGSARVHAPGLLRAPPCAVRRKQVQHPGNLPPRPHALAQGRSCLPSPSVPSRPPSSARPHLILLCSLNCPSR